MYVLLLNLVIVDDFDEWEKISTESIDLQFEIDENEVIISKINNYEFRQNYFEEI